MREHPIAFLIFSFILLGAVLSFWRRVVWARKAYVGYPPLAWRFNRAIMDGLMADAVIGFLAMMVLMALGAP